ncbi:MAG: hypothetical protein EOP40_09165 [Rubrivivax sp.]|nr:MAG: hypothetical protein EOP40_09165 [Rubrivivax sp.]
MGTRLHTELHRLYGPGASASPTAGLDGLIDEDGQVRAMALSLGRPADWEAISGVWQAVQSDLSLPAPGIAVSGMDSYQLWFSLDEAVPAAQAQAFVEALRVRYLSAMAPSRVTLLPGRAPEATRVLPPASEWEWPAGALPPQQIGTDQWSAFVAPDLAPIFADTPWLDIPPSLDGQAELLSRLRSIKPGAWQSARALLTPAPAEAPASPTAEPSGSPGPHQDPWRFLLQVMNDATVPMASRIEAAKALLPYTKRSEGPASGS